MLRERPFIGSRAARRRPWPIVSWWFSLLFFVPLAIIGGRFITHDVSKTPSVVLRVTDASNGKALSGAQVKAGELALVSDGHGQVDLKLPAKPMTLTVRLANYEPMFGQLDHRSDTQQAVALRPTTLTGTLTDAKSGKPIPGATVSVVAADGGQTSGAATTGADGAFRLLNVPANARVHVDAGDYGVAEEAIAHRTRIDVKLKRSVATGTVTNSSGAPIQGAIVGAGGAQAVTKEDGTYRLTGVPDGGDVVVKAPGYVDARVPLAQDHPANVSLKTMEIKAVYVSGSTAGTADALNPLIDLVDRTELNAMVVDIKEDVIYYDSQVKFFRDAGTVQPTYDAGALLKTLHDHHIYVIARLVVFKDAQVAEKYPDLSVKDANTGGLWRDNNNAAWVNPFNHQIWQANIDLAMEATKLGFDEIQYDYVRFPSDGDLSKADFGQPYNAGTRVAAIAGFLTQSREALMPTGVKVAIDIFGITALYDDDQGIGQRMRDLAPLVDYVCPMLYPSHFTADAIDVGGEPNDHPYDVMRIGLAGAKDKMPGGMALKLRPWLQDFKYPGKRAYTSDDVAAQIKAANEAGTSGWMVWNAGGDYHQDVFAAGQ